MRIAQPKCLKRVLRMLAAIADSAHGEARDLVHQRIHLKWNADSVRLLASDGHRSVAVTLFSADRDVTHPEAQAAIVLPFDLNAPVLKYETHTIFKGANGNVLLIGTQVAPSTATREFGIDIGHDDKPWPVEYVESRMREFNGDVAGTRELEVNPEYMSEALTIINGLWELLDTAPPPRIRMIVPGAPDRPLLFTSRGVDANGRPMFSVELLVMPYRPT